MTAEEIIKRFEALADPDAEAGMARFGIRAAKVYGVRIPHLRTLARELGVDDALAEELWASPTRETRILATMIADPALTDSDRMERWALDFDSWEVCDQCCMNLFSDVALAPGKCRQWSSRTEEYVKRSGFVLMAQLAVVDKCAPDKFFRAFFPLIKRGATDPRAMVKKGVNWALRQIGKRNLALRDEVEAVAGELTSADSPAARWVGSDALRELTQHDRIEKMKRREAKRD
jgi:3-methyladenine DNA glycosylase AlkD